MIVFYCRYLLIALGLALVCYFVLTASAVAEESCLPIEMPAADAFFSAKKRVFAHYFNRFPISIDNRAPTEDYYAKNYLRPEGESGKWQAQGGFLRSRPLPLPPGDPNRYAVENLKAEIRLALSRGITGFTYDILSPDDVKPGGRLSQMLTAAEEVDPRFAIMPMPDMASLKGDVAQFVTIINALYDQKGLFHLPDGRLVVSPFLAEAVQASVWAATLREFASNGKRLAFIPTSLSLGEDRVRLNSDFSFGFATFGTPLPSEGEGIKRWSAALSKQGKLFMAGIGVQGYRPKDYLYWEAQGSTSYRNSWRGAIDGGAEWIQLTTWNDFSETTQIEPYTDSAGAAGTGFFDLTAVYASEFVLGEKPQIIRDALYYFYRRQKVAARAEKMESRMNNAVPSQPGLDQIELVGVLAAPGTLEIRVGDKVFRKDVEAGVQSFSAPLVSGTPRFSLLRKGVRALTVDGSVTVDAGTAASGGYTDLTYWSGGASVGAGNQNCSH